jgi:hypothetical protein
MLAPAGASDEHVALGGQRQGMILWFAHGRISKRKASEASLATNGLIVSSWL